MNAVLLLSLLVAPADSVQQQVGVQAHTGFIIPHAPDLREVSRSRPAGIELSYDRIALTRLAYENCHCFARVGAYANYVTYNNPAELGRAVGAGAYFEPLINYGKPVFFSVRATAGLTYLSRVFDARTNPRNTFFSTPLNAFLALSARTHLQINPHLQVTIAGNYNHISNGGTRQPNRGMNFPSVSAGLTYVPHPIPVPNPKRWPTSRLKTRFTSRLMPFASIRTLPQTNWQPERPTWLLGLTATAGYRISRFHTLSGGMEVVHDGYVAGQLRRNTQTPDPWQAALLGGYELWLGRYRFTTHAGWNAYQADFITNGRVFQRYQLLYTAGPRIRLGVGLKAKLNVAEGFDLRAGLAL
jgi:hypothetical protein